MELGPTLIAMEIIILNKYSNSRDNYIGMWRAQKGK